MGWVLVATAAAARGLSDSEIATIARAAGAEGRRLGPEAAEFALAVRPPDDAPARAGLDGVDLNAVAREGRRKRILIADMDSTIIGVECIDELAAEAGLGARVRAITERAMAGELDFEGALRARLALLDGLEEAALERVWTERIRLNAGARTLVRTMAAAGATTVLVSGGFTWFTERVAAAAGFAEHRANRLRFQGGRLVGAPEEPVLGADAKLEALGEIAARTGRSPADALAIGDGANDIPMVRAAGLGVGYRPKPALAAAADAVLRHSDLSAALYLQGYRAADIPLD